MREKQVTNKVLSVRCVYRLEVEKRIALEAVQEAVMELLKLVQGEEA